MGISPSFLTSHSNLLHINTPAVCSPTPEAATVVGWKWSGWAQPAVEVLYSFLYTAYAPHPGIMCLSSAMSGPGAFHKATTCAPVPPCVTGRLALPPPHQIRGVPPHQGKG